MKFEFWYTFCCEWVGEWMVEWMDKIYLHPLIKKVRVTECNKVVYITGLSKLWPCIIYLLINKVYKYELPNQILTY